MENYFKKLSAINVKGMAEKKGNFNYLSWANAWDLIKKQYPKLKTLASRGLNIGDDDQENLSDLVQS